MPETILIIEDDPLQADVVRLLLEHNGFEIVLAGDGADGLRKLYEVQPDLVILDLDPAADGWLGSLPPHPRNVHGAHHHHDLAPQR